MPTHPDVTQYQNRIAQMLQEYYGVDTPVKKEWASKFAPGIYSPRVDIAVGPFSIVEGERLIDEYNDLFEKSQILIHRLIEFHSGNLLEQQLYDDIYGDLVNTNPNARCFLAIEIELSGSRKHLMGDAVNAAALGRIGIVVGWTDEMFHAFLNLKRYFEYLKNVNKNTFNLDNLLILNRDQLIETIYSVM